MKRLVDLLLIFALSPIVLVVFAAVALAVSLTSNGPILYWAKRIGANSEPFWMPKFRTMRTGTPEVATHLLEDPAKWLTPVGSFLRKSSLDELPQLISVLRGDMTLVGPRPALHSQADLIAARAARGVDALRPGITGWAQINGRDELPIPVKVEFDHEYLVRRSTVFDALILARTATSVVLRKGVSH